MRVLILGANGMLGHKLYQELGKSLDVYGTVRDREAYAGLPNVLEMGQLIANVEARNLLSVERALGVVKPDVVVNAIGVTKHVPGGLQPQQATQINTVLPQRLAELSRLAGFRFITVSTDCVFSGGRGQYSELDVPDATDLYGRSKLLGEVNGENVLTLRTSIIGRELGTRRGLVEWFLNHSGPQVSGYSRAVFSGLTTIELARILSSVITGHTDLTGLLHVSSQPIDKYSLLCKLADAYNIQVSISPIDEPRIDRSLDSTRFRDATNIPIPAWDQMITEMACDKTPYDDLHHQNAKAEDFL